MYKPFKMVKFEGSGKKLSLRINQHYVAPFGKALWHKRPLSQLDTSFAVYNGWPSSVALFLSLSFSQSLDL